MGLPVTIILTNEMQEYWIDIYMDDITVAHNCHIKYFVFDVSNLYYFDVSNLFLMWAICIWCQDFVFDVSNLYLMWQLWATILCIFKLFFYRTFS